MDNKQGVTSIIKFPTTQDEVAVSNAISDLLREGWKFDDVSQGKIALIRTWEYDPAEFIGAIEVPPDQPGE